MCKACAALEISCRYGEEKPEWMDGGTQQREMAEMVKEQVRKHAGKRREKRYLAVLAGERGGPTKEQNAAPAREVVMSEGDSAEALGRFPALAIDDHTTAGNNKSSPEGATSTASASATGSSPAGSAETPDTNHSHSPYETASQPLPRLSKDALRKRETYFAMMYIDYAFPRLFPYYRPTLLSGGRAWLLTPLKDNNVLKNITMSTSAYLFMCIIDAQHPSETTCHETILQQLNRLQGEALHQLQKDIGEITSAPGVDAGKVYERVKVLQAVMQLLVFEVAVGNTDTWKMHLDAAIALFVQVVPAPDAWNGTLQMLEADFHSMVSLHIDRPYAPDAGAVLFYTAFLLFADIISSIALGHGPRLTAYHDVIIPMFASAPRKRYEICLEHYVGVPNWLMRTIGDISTMRSWKAAQQTDGSLSVTELVTRGSRIEQALRNGIRALDEQSPQGATQTPTAAFASLPLPAVDFSMNLFPFSESHRTEPLLALNTRIWASAALTYLAVTISGWQPACHEISSSVATTTKLLERLSAISPEHFRGVTWPFCLTACLQLGEQERDRMRAMAKRCAAPLGTMRAATTSMEMVWAAGCPLDPSGGCILGLHGLLV